MTNLVVQSGKKRSLTWRKHAPLLFLCAVALAGCHVQSRVYDVNGQPAMTATGASATIEETRGAILRAAQERGYAVESDDGRTMMARVSSGDIWALMRIDYAAGVYSISHADSSVELRYDPSRGTVHRRYNRWVSRLQQSIERELWQPSGPNPSPMPEMVASVPAMAPMNVPAPPPPPAQVLPAPPSNVQAMPAPMAAPSGAPASGWVPGGGNGAVAAPPPSAPATPGALDM
jgi:hypothetical protein